MRHLSGLNLLPRRRFLALSAATLTGALARWTARGARAERGRQEPADATGRAAAEISVPGAPDGRVVFPLTQGWLYGGRTVPGGTAAEFDDAGFARVTLPHTNWPVPWHAFDDRDYQFVSLYRRHFTPPAVLAGRRLFADFDGVMAAATVWLNGARLAEHRGGHVPFSVELTGPVRWGADNVLAVEVDSNERADIPPFGGALDFLTFGGIYREAALRAVPGTFIEDVFARPVDVLGPGRHLDVRCRLASDGRTGPGAPPRLAVALRDGAAGQTLATAEAAVALAADGPTDVDLRLDGLGAVELWDLDRPTLYDVEVTLLGGDAPLDACTTRVGFRDARFTPQGFFLNGRRVALRGLNRHQSFPFVGQAMPARVQRRDAQLLKDFGCTIVRAADGPPSPHFLDACDELGLLVFEELPGWQYIGDAAWQDLACRDVEAMIRRDRNRPAIVLWGVRVNESRDDHAFYARTNALARALDDSRPTAGVRYDYHSELLEDVFAMNDFGDPLLPPNHPLYLVTEFCGHKWPTKRGDNVERVQEHALWHARILDQLAADDRYAGGLGWCAFDYHSHANFGSGDRVCYHGVADLFRIPKPAAAVYQSQRDPADALVLEPTFHWGIGDQAGAGGVGVGVILANCDRLRLYVADQLVDEVEPDRARFPHLPHPPFVSARLGELWTRPWGDLRIEGYLGGQLVATRRLAGRGVDAQFLVEPDDTTLAADGADMTRVVLRVTDDFGGPRPLATGAVALTLEGPGALVGENPFALVDGVGAVWVRAGETAGTLTLRAAHPILGARAATIQVVATPPAPL